MATNTSTFVPSTHNSNFYNLKGCSVYHVYTHALGTKADVILNMLNTTGVSHGAGIATGNALYAVHVHIILK